MFSLLVGITTTKTPSSRRIIALDPTTLTILKIWKNKAREDYMVFGNRKLWENDAPVFSYTHTGKYFHLATWIESWRLSILSILISIGLLFIKWGIHTHHYYLNQRQKLKMCKKNQDILTYKQLWLFTWASLQPKAKKRALPFIRKSALFSDVTVFLIEINSLKTPCIIMF